MKQPKDDNIVRCPKCGKRLKTRHNKTGDVRCACKNVFKVRKGRVVR